MAAMQETQEWQDAPSWLLRCALNEQWGVTEWQEWEILRVRLEELGVEISPEGEAPNLTAVHAYREVDGWVTAVKVEAEPHPVHQALHQLVRRLAERAED
jgi:hypothetical protein